MEKNCKFFILNLKKPLHIKIDLLNTLFLIFKNIYKDFQFKMIEKVLFGHFL